MSSPFCARGNDAPLSVTFLLCCIPVPCELLSANCKPRIVQFDPQISMLSGCDLRGSLSPSFVPSRFKRSMFDVRCRAPSSRLVFAYRSYRFCSRNARARRARPDDLDRWTQARVGYTCRCAWHEDSLPARAAARWNLRRGSGGTLACHHLSQPHHAAHGGVARRAWHLLQPGVRPP